MATPVKSSKKPTSKAASKPVKVSVAKPAGKLAKVKDQGASKVVARKAKAAALPKLKTSAKKPGIAIKEETGKKAEDRKQVAKLEHPAVISKEKTKPDKASAKVAKAATKSAGAGKKATAHSHVMDAPPEVKQPPQPAKTVEHTAKPTPPRAAEVAKATPAEKDALVSKPEPASKGAVIDPASTPPANPTSHGGHSTAFVDKQRQRLLDLRDELVDAMSGMTRDTIRNAPEGSEASGSGMHQGDAGSDAYDRDFALSVLAKEQDAIYEIEEALKRIRRGTYGVCELSGKKIPHTRLEAIPFARLTVECQAQWEKEYGNRRFRPSNQVGFAGGQYEEEEDSETVSLDEEED